jgi:hypothetical protein
MTMVRIEISSVFNFAETGEYPDLVVGAQLSIEARRLTFAHADAGRSNPIESRPMLEDERGYIDYDEEGSGPMILVRAGFVGHWVGLA